MCRVYPNALIHRTTLYAFWEYDLTWFWCIHTIHYAKLDHLKWYRRCVHRMLVDLNTLHVRLASTAKAQQPMLLHPFGQRPSCQHVHNTSRNFWHMIVQQTIQNHVIQSNAQRMHLVLYHHLQILDMLNRRMGIAFYSEMEKKRSFYAKWFKEYDGKFDTNLHDISYLFPLFLCWITAGWIMSACMQNDNSTFGCIVQILQQSLEINSTCFWIPITICSNVRETGTGKYFLMVFCHTQNTRN